MAAELNAEAAGRAARDSGVHTIQRALAILELVAGRGGASAKEISAALGFPLPTVYRLARALVQKDYLVHLKLEQRYELGFKLDRLGVSLHRQVGVADPVRAQIAALHDGAQAAAYFAVYRGNDVVVAHVVDCVRHPRITPLRFGFHEAAHATAFGKILLAAMSRESATRYLEVHGMPRLTSQTITCWERIGPHLQQVAERGVAWERGEFVAGMTCAAIGVHDGAGMILGSVAVSLPTREVTAARERELERMLRESANLVSRYYRVGT